MENLTGGVEKIAWLIQEYGRGIFLICGLGPLLLLGLINLLKHDWIAHNGGGNNTGTGPSSSKK